MLLTVVQHVAALAERAKVPGAVVAGLIASVLVGILSLNDLAF